MSSDAKKSAASTPKKVFDIARPKDVKPSASSRPVIVGHKPLVADPMMSVDTSAPKKAKKEVTLGSLAQTLTGDAVGTAPTVDTTALEPAPVDSSRLSISHKKILPISDGFEAPEPVLPAMKGNTDTTPAPETVETPTNVPEIPAEEVPVLPIPATVATKDDKTEIPSELTFEADASAPADSAPSSESTDTDTTDSGAAVDAVASQAKAKQEQKKEQEETTARAAEIEKLTNDKTYFLPIHEARRKHSSNAASVVLIILLLAAIGVYGAIDAGYLDVGIDMPYDFIKS